MHRTRAHIRNPACALSACAVCVCVGTRRADCASVLRGCRRLRTIVCPYSMSCGPGMKHRSLRQGTSECSPFPLTNPCGPWPAAPSFRSRFAGRRSTRCTGDQEPSVRANAWDLRTRYKIIMIVFCENRPVRFSTTAKKALPRNTDFICGNQKRTANPHKCTFSCGIGRDFHI